MDILIILLIILAVTRVAGEIASRLGQPELIGQLVAGIILGMVFPYFESDFPVLATLLDDHAFLVITELGVFFLMLNAGLEMGPRELMEASRKAILIAIAGLVLPFVSGVLLAWFYLPESDSKIPQLIFIGTALAITAIPVAAKILMEMGELRSKLGKTIISAALFDDVMGLILLAILTALIETGEALTLTDYLWLGFRVFCFFAIVIILGRNIMPKLAAFVPQILTEETEFSLLLILGLAYALLAELLGLHFILGAFMAALFFTRRLFGSKSYKDVRNKVNAISSGFLAPIFFASIGLHLDLTAIVQIPVFVFLLVALAIFSKLIGAGVTARLLGSSRSEAASIGISMSARGAVELIIAEVALKAGLFNQPDNDIVNYLYSAIVIMAITTTIVMPVGFRYILKKQQAEESG